MKGTITRKSTVQPQSLTVKGHTTSLHQLTGTWVRITNEGMLTGDYKRLGSQNGFYAAHKKAGTVFVIMTGENKGFWSYVDRH